MMLTVSSIRGFTLIELMVVVAIIGILMLFAIPQYQNYTVRAKLGEVLQLLGATKTGVTEFAISQGQWPDGIDKTGLQDPQGQYIGLFQYKLVNQQPILSVQVKNMATEVDGKFLSLEGNNKNGYVWSCRGGDQQQASAIPEAYLPGICRKKATGIR